jgi:hypothetical protein
MKYGTFYGPLYCNGEPSFPEWKNTCVNKRPFSSPNLLHAGDNFRSGTFSNQPLTDQFRPITAQHQTAYNADA